MSFSLLVSCNPNPNSLTVTTAQLCYTALTQQDKYVKHIYLDEIEYVPLISQEEIQRRISFDTTTLEHQKLLKTASTLVLFFPDWFGFPPALLVGWMQRVFAPSIAFEYFGKEFEPKQRRGLLTDLKILLIISSDENKNSNAVTHSTNFLQKRIFSYCGITQLQSIVLYDTHNLSTKQKKQWIQQCIDTCCTYI